MKKEAKYQLPFRSHPITGGRSYVLEGGNKELFIKLYPTTFNEELAGIFGTCGDTIEKFGRELGLTKDKTKIYQKASVKRVATARANGSYVGRKGRKLSEKALLKLRSIFDSGFRRMEKYKAEHTEEEYLAMIKRRSEKFKETLRKDLTRRKYGLEQRTERRILDDSEKRARNQKYDMIYHCNYFADPAHPNWVCYDKDTKRSAVREATAIRRGLEIVEGE